MPPALFLQRPTHGAIPNAAAAALSLRPAICSGSTSCLQNVLLRRALAGQRLGVTAAAGPSGPSPSSTVVVASELDVGYSSAQGARDTMVGGEAMSLGKRGDSWLRGGGGRCAEGSRAGKGLARAGQGRLVRYSVRSVAGTAQRAAWFWFDVRLQAPITGLWCA